MIWTLQRTGGTNLSYCLNTISDRPQLRDEPFNPRRIHGHLAKDWRRTKNEIALQQGLDEICSARPNFKHCVEPVPKRLNTFLVDCTIAHGYRHIFLYRRNFLERILSLEYATRTAIWGPEHVETANKGCVTAAMEVPLDADGIIRRAMQAHTRLNRTWTALQTARITPITISFEELYAADEAVIKKSLTRVFMGLEQRLNTAQITEFQKMIRSSGRQNTRNSYNLFKGIDLVKARLAEIPDLLCSA